VTEQLDGVQEKVGWANSHYACLRDEIHEWVQRHMHSEDTDFYPDAGIHVIRWEARPTPPLWSVMSGNIVHNLRSALDHLVWQMVLANGVEAPREGTGGNGFPIKRTPPGKGETFESIFVANGKLVGVHPDHIALIEDCQPYKILSKGGSPEQHVLAMLDKLWQIDKHRHLHFTAFVLPPEPTMELTFEVRDDSARLVDFHVFDEPPRRLQDGEVLAWFRFERMTPEAHVDANLDLPAQPAINELGAVGGPPGTEGMLPIGQTLSHIGHYVAGVIQRAATTPPF
jgi:hypothetical protein